MDTVVSVEGGITEVVIRTWCLSLQGGLLAGAVCPLLLVWLVGTSDPGFASVMASGRCIFDTPRCVVYQALWLQYICVVIGGCAVHTSERPYC